MSCGRLTVDDGNLQGHLRQMSKNTHSSGLPAIFTAAAQGFEEIRCSPAGWLSRKEVEAPRATMTVRASPGLPAAVETNAVPVSRSIVRRNITQGILPLAPGAEKWKCRETKGENQQFGLQRGTSVNSARSTDCESMHTPMLSSSSVSSLADNAEVHRRFEGGVKQQPRKQPSGAAGPQPLPPASRSRTGQSMHATTGQLTAPSGRQQLLSDHLTQNRWMETTCPIDCDTEVPEELFESLLVAAKEVRKRGQHILVPGGPGRNNSKAAHLVHQDVFATSKGRSR